MNSRSVFSVKTLAAIGLSAVASIALAQAPMQQQIQQRMQQQNRAGAAMAVAAKVGQVSIGSPWARATAPGAAVGGGFLMLENAGADDKLVGASSPVSSKV